MFLTKRLLSLMTTVGVCPSKTGQRVLDLLKHIPGKNHVVVTDNLYSSEALALELLRKNMYTLGTLWKNRLPVGKPAEMLTPEAHAGLS